jgi:hypothetical protein
MTRQSGRERATAFLTAWETARDGADIGFRIGASDTGKPAILISVDDGDFMFMEPEAKAILQLIRNAITMFPRDAEAADFPRLADGIQTCLDAIAGGKRQ